MNNAQFTFSVGINPFNSKTIKRLLKTKESSEFICVETPNKNT